MSEITRRNLEKLEAKPEISSKTPEFQEQQIDQIEAKTKQTAELNQARQEAAKEAISVEQAKAVENLNTSSEQTDEDNANRHPVSSSLKKITFRKEIKHIRRNLSKADRIGSKIIHQPVIKSVSEVSAKTITRPSGLLGGGIMAFLGTSAYLYLTKHIGLKYNYSIFLFLLVAGFIVGLIIEALVRLVRGKRTA